MRKLPKLAFSPTRLQHSDDPILSLRSPNELTLHLFIIFFLLCSQYVIDLIKKLETHLMVVSIFLKIKFRHAQISVPKISISMSKAACINPWFNPLRLECSRSRKTTSFLMPQRLKKYKNLHSRSFMNGVKTW